MPSKKKREMSWDEIGNAIGNKFEKMGKKLDNDEKFSFWKRHWMIEHREKGGGFGRLLFILGVLFLLDFMGTLDVSTVPWWILVLIVIGFTAMRF